MSEKKAAIILNVIIAHAPLLSSNNLNKAGGSFVPSTEI